MLRWEIGVKIGPATTSSKVDHDFYSREAKRSGAVARVTTRERAMESPLPGTHASLPRRLTGCYLPGLGADRAVPGATAVVLYRDVGEHRSLRGGDGQTGALALILAR